MRRECLWSKSVAWCAGFLLAGGLTCSVRCHRSPSLADRIRATASRLEPELSGDEIPKFYEQEVIALAKEPTADLEEAFRSLDTARLRGRYGQPPNDAVWLTGMLITILAFDCPPVSARDWETYYNL